MDDMSAETADEVLLSGENGSTAATGVGAAAGLGGDLSILNNSSSLHSGSSSISGSSSSVKEQHSLPPAGSTGAPLSWRRAAAAAPLRTEDRSVLLSLSSSTSSSGIGSTAAAAAGVQQQQQQQLRQGVGNATAELSGVPAAAAAAAAAGNASASLEGSVEGAQIGDAAADANTALLLESALDSLVTQLSSSSLRRDLHQRMAEQLRSGDIAARLEATQAYRRSLAHRQELERQQQQQQHDSRSGGSSSLNCTSCSSSSTGSSNAGVFERGGSGVVKGGVSDSGRRASAGGGVEASASPYTATSIVQQQQHSAAVASSGSASLLLGGIGETDMPTVGVGGCFPNNSAPQSNGGGGSFEILRSSGDSACPRSALDCSTSSGTTAGASFLFEGAAGRGGGAVMDATIDDIVKSDLLGEVVASLSLPHPLLQLESVLLIQRLSRGSAFPQLRQIVTRPLLQALVDLLLGVTRGRIQTGAVELRIAVLSLLAKLAQEFKAHKDFSLLKPLYGLLPAVVEAVQAAPDLEGARCVHALVCSNLLQLKVDVGPVLSLLVWFLKNSREQAVLCLAASSCVTLCERPEGVDIVLSSHALPTVLQLLRQSDDQRVVFDALSVAAKIAFVGSTAQIDRAISMGAVQAMMDVLLNPAVSNPTTRARACNTLGNLGCETPKQVQPIIDTQAFPLLVDIFQNDPDYNTRIEAAYAVCACLSRADPNQVGYIISCTARSPVFPGAAGTSLYSRRLGVAAASGCGTAAGGLAATTTGGRGYSAVFLHPVAAWGAGPAAGAAGSDLSTSFFYGGPGVLYGGWRSIHAEKTPPAILSFGSGNPCLRLIADMLELVCESDPTNSGSLKLCKAILRGLDNILDVGAQEAKMLGLTENPYARLFHEVQGDLKLTQMQFFPEYYIAAKTHSILEKYFDVATTWNSKQP